MSYTIHDYLNDMECEGYMPHEPDYEDIHTRNMEAREMDRQEPTHVPITKKRTWEVDDLGRIVLHTGETRAYVTSTIVLERRGTTDNFRPADLESAELLSDLLD